MNELAIVMTLGSTLLVLLFILAIGAIGDVDRNEDFDEYQKAQIRKDIEDDRFKEFKKQYLSYEVKK